MQAAESVEKRLFAANWTNFANVLLNLYNQRPTWLDLAHRRLDEAVFAAYG